jgi:hypothetical protein
MELVTTCPAILPATTDIDGSGCRHPEIGDRQGEGIVLKNFALFGAAQ